MIVGARIGMLHSLAGNPGAPVSARVRPMIGHAAGARAGGGAEKISRRKNARLPAPGGS